MPLGSPSPQPHKKNAACSSGNPLLSVGLDQKHPLDADIGVDSTETSSAVQCGQYWRSSVQCGQYWRALRQYNVDSTETSSPVQCGRYWRSPVWKRSSFPFPTFIWRKAAEKQLTLMHTLRWAHDLNELRFQSHHVDTARQENRHHVINNVYKIANYLMSGLSASSSANYIQFGNNRSVSTFVWIKDRTILYSNKSRNTQLCFFHKCRDKVLSLGPRSARANRPHVTLRARLRRGTRTSWPPSIPPMEGVRAKFCKAMLWKCTCLYLDNA